MVAEWFLLCLGLAQAAELGFDVSQIDEDAALGPRGRPALLRLGKADPKKPPLVFVHGMDGGPADFQPLVDRLKGEDYQLHVLAYDDKGRTIAENGDDFAELLRDHALPWGEVPLTIVAHSLGGLVSRRALNTLARDSTLPFSKVRLLAVDTPWHGYPGPSDEGADGAAMAVARLVIPAGYDEVRAESGLFKSGLLTAALPEHYSICLVFAEDGDDVWDYTEGDLKELPKKLAAHYGQAKKVRGSPRLRNFWNALRSSAAFRELDADLRRAAQHGRLESAAAKALRARFPRLPGNHATVLRSEKLADAIEACE